MSRKTKRHDLTHLERPPVRPLKVGIHGGTCRAGAMKPEAFRSSVVTAADAVEPLAPESLAPSVIAVPLGEGHSVVSVNGVYGDFDHILANGGNHQFRKGAEADRAVGMASARATMSSHHAKERAEEPYRAVAATLGGSFPAIDAIDFYGSGGQSTGGGAFVEDVQLVPFRREVLDFVNERVSTGYTFCSRLGKPQKLKKNVVAWVVCMFAWLRSLSKANANEVRLLTLTNLPCATNEADKQFLAGAFLQSYLAESLRADRAEHRNSIADNSSGRIAIVRFGHFTPIEPHEISAEARRKYLRPLEELLRTSPQPLSVEGALKIAKSVLPYSEALTFSSLIAAAKSIAASKDKRDAKKQRMKRLLDAAAVSPQTFTIDATVKYKGLEEIALSRLLEYLDKLGARHEAFKMRRRIIATILRDIRALLGELKLAEQHQKRSLVRRLASLGWALTWLAAVTGFFLARLLILMIPPKLRSKWVLKAFTNVVRSALALAELTASIVFFEGLVAGLEAEQKRLNQQLDDAAESVRKVPHGEESGPGTVEMLDLDESWVALRQMDPSQPDLNQDTFSRLVKHVTARGLQKILDAPDADAETLVKTALTTEPKWAPQFGEGTNWNIDDKVAMLPRVDAALRTLLMQHAGKLAHHGKLFFADAATYCVVTKLHFATPCPFEKGAVAEIIRGPLLTAFKETISAGEFRGFYPDAESRRAAAWAAAQLKIRPSTALLAALASDIAKKSQKNSGAPQRPTKPTASLDAAKHPRFNGHAAEPGQS